MNSDTGAILLENDAVLTGTGGNDTHVTIAGGVAVTLKGVDITAITGDHHWTGITCLGDATIILADGTANTVKGGYENYPGIYVPVDKTLTIQGSGSLNASSNGEAAGIGGGFYIPCGSIIIEGGNITATGGNRSAGIGSGRGTQCGTITISGGSVTAAGGANGAGIGSGYEGTCGDISISGGSVTAAGGEYGAGIGSGSGYKGTCGTISLSWTNATDSITASSYNGDVTLVKDFVIDGNGTPATTANIAGQTITPAGAHNITVTASENGTVTAPSKAFADETVTLTVTPAAGYVLKSVTAMGADETAITVTNNQFTMPDSAVTVTAEFEKEQPAFRAHSLVLDGEIGVNFYLSVPEEFQVGSSMTFTVNGKETTQAFSAAVKRTENGVDLYGFTCYITSIEMADTISAVFHYGDGLTISQSYSAADYIAQGTSQITDQTARALIDAIADYGSYVQQFLAEANSFTCTPMDAKTELTATDIDDAKAALESYKLVSVNNSSDILQIGYSLNLQSRTTLSVYVKLPDGYTGDVTAKLQDNTELTVSHPSDDVYQVDIANIAAHELGNPHDIEFTTESGSCTVTVSALTYAYKQINNPTNVYSKNAMTALYRYYAATVAYRNAHPSQG